MANTKVETDATVKFMNALYEELADRKKTKVSFAEELGVTTKSFNNWSNGRGMPLDVADKAMKLLDVNYVIGK